MSKKLIFRNLDEAQYYFGGLNIKEIETKELVIVMLTAQAVYDNLKLRSCPGIVRNFWYTLQKTCNEQLKFRKASIATLSKDEYQSVIGIVGLVEISADSKALVEMMKKMTTDDLLENVEYAQANDNNSRIILELMQEELIRRAMSN